MMRLLRQINERIEAFAERNSSTAYERKQVVILIRACILTAFFMYQYMGVSWYIDFDAGFKALPFEGALFALLPLMFFTGLRINVIGNLFVLIGYSFGLNNVFFSGGMFSPVMPWLTLMPICALLFVDKRSAFAWALIVLVTTLGMAYYWSNHGDFPSNYDTGKQIFFYTNCFSGLIFIYLGLNLIFEYALRKANDLLESRNAELVLEKEKSDGLLRNILPAEVAEELKEYGHSDARLFNTVTVLFTDFQNFTEISGKHEPQQLVSEINECFSAFDSICERCGIEKIKTIGDAYMAAGGLPTPTDDHAVNTVKAALMMRDFIAQRQAAAQAEDRPVFRIRIGIHSGPVVAGIVGIKKFQYDIWGDTVNTASRMESGGEVGKVNISQATYELVKDDFACQFRGEVEAKGKGKLNMYFVSERG